MLQANQWSTTTVEDFRQKIIELETVQKRAFEKRAGTVLHEEKPQHSPPIYLLGHIYAGPFSASRFNLNRVTCRGWWSKMPFCAILTSKWHIELKQLSGSLSCQLNTSHEPLRKGRECVIIIIFACV